MVTWDEVISERDRQVFELCEKLGCGPRTRGFGNRPAVIVVDVNYAFVGDKPEPILESMQHHPFSCGEEGWQSVYQISKLLSLARNKNVPIVYSTGGLKGLSKGSSHIPTLDTWSLAELGGSSQDFGVETQIVREIAPADNDIIIYKDAPSVFFGTSLVSYLRAIDVDTLLFCGTTTSGCVRASVVDAYSFNYRVVVVEECTFDRVEISHKINLADMHAKYADVVSLARVEDYLHSLPSPKVANAV